LADLFAISSVQREVAQHVILFHGLGGHPHDTWWSINEPKVCWPRWLAEDIQGLAVWSVGYEAAVSRWRGSAMHLTDRATNLLERILAEPKLQSGELILIGHSLGGVLIKQLLRTADSMALQRSEVGALVKRVRRVVFVATPHSGAALATLVDRLRILVRPSLATASLVRNDPNLRDLNLWYREWSSAQHIEHLILTESRFTRFAGLIVKPDSSDPGLLSRPIPIDADHITICKPIDRTSEVYVHVRNFIIRPATSRNLEKFIESTLETQSARIETLTDTIREHSSQLKDAISDQAKTTAEIVTENLSRVASSVRLYPRDLVDNEIEKQLSIIRRARFFGGFSTSECALRLGDKILNGELAGGSDTVKSSALALK
jgi:pimeloyl-ACP methyl ester carboxylesterase